MWRFIKRSAKRNVRNTFLKNLAHFGKAINRLYENRNYDIHSNGEKNVLEKLSSHEARFIIDVGANEGEYAAAAKEIIPGVTIHCFEPSIESIPRLEQRFQGDSSIHVHPVGLHNVSGEATLNLYSHDQHSSMLTLEGMTRAVKSEESITVMRGDDFLVNANISKVDLLKIDVEGVEFEVIKGFDQSFENKVIRACQFEYGYANITSHNLLADFYRYFEDKGYKLGKIYPKRVEFRPYNVKHEDFLGPNFLAVNEKESHLIQSLSN